MTKQEFVNLVGKDVTDEEYSAIEEVYMYYPNITSKQQVAELYKTFGMRIIYDMRSTAVTVRQYEESITWEQQRLSEIIKDYKKFLEKY